jgi:drug/metabolite transporter (DMT)-like permease
MKSDSPPPDCLPCPEEAHAAVPPPTWLLITAFGAVYLIWGSTYLGIRLAIDTIPPLLMAGSRFVLAGLILYGVMRRRGAAKPTPAQWSDAAIIGTLLLLAGNGGVTWAEKRVPTNLAALIVAVTPLWIIVVDWLRPQGRRPHGLVFGGLLFGFAGVALIVGSRTHGGSTLVDPAGAVVLLVASVLWACGSVFSRHARQPASALLGVSMQMITGGAILLLVGTCMGEIPRFDPQAVSKTSLWAFVYLTLFGSLIGFTAYVWLLRVSTPARVSTYAYVNPLIAVCLGYLFLREPLPPGVMLAGALILTGVALITVKGQAREEGK